jgi:hypothetical protein
MDVGCGTDDWSEPDEDSYVSAPYSKWETVQVRCPNCGGGHIMPMDGGVPTKMIVALDPALQDSAMIKGETIDWDRLMPFITRYAQGLAKACPYG